MTACPRDQPASDLPRPDGPVTAAQGPGTHGPRGVGLTHLAIGAAVVIATGGRLLG